MYWLCVVLFSFPMISSAIHLDLKFDLELKHVPHDCRNTTSCKLPYFISLLESDGTYDMKAVMLADGHIRQTERKRSLREDTVISIPTRLHTSFRSGNLYVGIKIYGLPSASQDYFIMDAGKAISHSNHRKVKMAIESNGVLFRAILRTGTSVVNSVLATNGCSCRTMTCGCCEHLNIPKIGLDDTGCANITYLPKPVYGLSFTFSINGLVLYNNTVSARNPPPICFDVPHLKEYASICLKFHDLHLGQGKFEGCIKLEAELYHLRVAEHEMGCFAIPTHLKGAYGNNEEHKF